MKDINIFINEKLTDSNTAKICRLINKDIAKRTYNDLDELIFDLKKIGIEPVSKSAINRTKKEFSKYNEYQVDFICKKISNKSFTLILKDGQITNII